LLLSSMVGTDPTDTATTRAGENGTDYTRFLAPDGLKGARLGVARKYLGFNDHVDRVMAGALDVLKDQGAVLVDPADMKTTGQYDESELEVLLFEFKTDITRYLLTRPGVRCRSLSDLISFNEENREREMQWFGQDLFLKSEAKGSLASGAYRKALRRNHRLSREKGIDDVLTRHRLHALVAPTGGPAWVTDLLNGDHPVGGFSTAAAVAGYPHITVPAGFAHGLPVGISFFSGAWTEPTLLRLAFAFEQATKARRPPEFGTTEAA
jgi:amidase